MGLFPLSPTALSLAVGSMAVYQLLFAFILIALPKRATLLRLLSIAPLTAAALAVVRYVVVLDGPKQRHAPFLGILNIHFLGLVEYILLSRVDSAKLSELAAKDPNSAAAASAASAAAATNRTANGKTRERGPVVVTVGQQIWQALSLSCNARRIGTEWEVKNIYRRKGSPLSRLQFFAHVIPRIAFCYTLVDFLMLAPAPEPRMISVAKQTATHLWTLSGEDVGFRTAGTVVFWIIAYCMIYAMIHVPAVLAVGLGASTPDFWPHLFGPLSELWTIRGFWGTFWHQRLRKTLTAFSDFLSDRILFIPRGTTLSTYTRLFFVFALSGLLHHPIDLIQGLASSEAGSLAFFLLQPVGIVIEDAVQAATRGWPLPRWVRSVAGYVWVFAFLVCTTPRWMFATARLGTAPDMMPWPIAQPLMDMFASKQ
ncbi:hypothetical protein PWT90_02425 [Aphanocladium album]|nr:hypothetical protein PWT90_02425 [Aphanocladium album]